MKRSKTEIIKQGKLEKNILKKRAMSERLSGSKESTGNFEEGVEKVTVLFVHLLLYTFCFCEAFFLYWEHLGQPVGITVLMLFKIHILEIRTLLAWHINF